MFDYRAKWKPNPQMTTSYAKQLEDNIRWSISAGDIAREERLPTIRVLAQDLGLSTNTVRSVYKKLEREGYLVTRPHYGTYVLSSTENVDECTRDFQRAVKNVLRSALTHEEVRSIFEQTYEEFIRAAERKPLLIVETTQKAIDSLGKQIAEATGFPVEGILLRDFEGYVKKHQDEMDRYSAIVTTYFHYSRIRSTHGVYAPMVCGMVQNIRKTVIKALNQLPREGKAVIVCQRSDSVSALQNLVLSVRDDIEVTVTYDDCVKHKDDIADKLLIIGSSLTTADLMRDIVHDSVPVCELLGEVNTQSMNMLIDFLK